MYHRQRKVRVLFGLSDIILVTLGFEAAYRTRSLLQLDNVFFLTLERHALLLGFSVAVWVSVALWLEIYDRLDSGNPRIVLSDSARQAAYGWLAVVVFEYVLRMELSRPFVLLFTAYSWVLLLLFRLTMGRMAGVIRREFTAPHHIMVAGTNPRALRLAEALESSADYGIRLLGFLSEPAEPDPPESIELGKAYPVRPICDLPSILQRHVVDEIIFAVGSESFAELEEAFLLCDEEGVRTRIAVDFFPHINSTVSLERFESTPLLTFSAAPEDDLRLMAKRAIDILLAAAGLLVLAPFMLVVALLVRLTSPGPAVFRQVRCGLNGRRFTFYKFRSMVENAEELKAAVAHLNTRDTVFKIPDDPRLTLVGRYLRKFSIDEWPQLWNVLKGDMSLVGPRPAIPSEVDRYQRWQRRRLRMRPGLTCLWAVAGRDKVDFDTWMKLDMQYIDNWSLALDWKILLQTIPRVLTGHGAN